MRRYGFAIDCFNNQLQKASTALVRWGFAGGLLLIALLSACQTQPNQVFIKVDGGRQALTTEAGTVRAALDEAQIELGPLDRVNPDLYARLEPGLEIVVVRVSEEIDVKREVVSFERQVVTNEALATGETRLAQLGVNGEDEISVRVVYEDGVEVSRTEISRVTAIEPIPEILVVGPQGELPSVRIEGTIAYLANGNAWLMRDSSGSRRALTRAGNLDGRVFELSPDGRQLLYTTTLTDDIEQPLNQVWLASTTIVGEKPITLSLQGVLQATWSPVISQSQLAYSTARRTASPPGWQANNDLWLLDLSRPTPQPTQLLPPNTQGLYAWWGTTFTWSPDGRQLAYARADQIGLIDLAAGQPISDTLSPLLDFTPLKTFSEWVWVPDLSWSPDGKFIAAAVHGPPLASEPAEESQVFDLWLMNADGTVSAKVAEQIGMWANPAWGPAGIAFGEAIEPLRSVNSRYRIQVIDRDGSNKRQIFPFQEELGVKFPELVWSPSSQELLFAYNGNLYLTTSQGSPPKQLTLDGQASQPQWAAEASVISATSAISSAAGITGTTSVTASGRVTRSEVISPANAGRATPAISGPSTPQSATATPTATSSDDGPGPPGPETTPTANPTPTPAQDRATIQPERSVDNPSLPGVEENEGDNGP